MHALHVALGNHGFYPSDDDLRWWQFGDSTVAALKTFQAGGTLRAPLPGRRRCALPTQPPTPLCAPPTAGQACNGYPESGVCDVNTWRLLLGPDATPADLTNLRTGDSGAGAPWLQGGRCGGVHSLWRAAALPCARRAPRRAEHPPAPMLFETQRTRTWAA